jgi:hypothetical protein
MVVEPESATASLRSALHQTDLEEHVNENQVIEVSGAYMHYTALNFFEPLLEMESRLQYQCELVLNAAFLCDQTSEFQIGNVFS